MSNTNFQRLQRVQNAAARMFAKLHDANITQPSFLRISIGYRCVAESTSDYKIVILCYKAVKLQQPSYLTGLLSEVIYVRFTVNTVFNKHCYSSVLMLRLHHSEQSSLICTHC